MPGQILVNVSDLLAIRDALIADDAMEAYHQLRMIADPDCRNAFALGEHWASWEALAAASAKGE